jgi:hypothetical protein
MKKILRKETINPFMKNMEYAVRGEVAVRAEELLLVSVLIILEVKKGTRFSSFYFYHQCQHRKSTTVKSEAFNFFQTSSFLYFY